MINFIKHAIISAALLFGFQPVAAPVIQYIPQQLGSIQAAADFTTSLASGISSSATSMQVESLTTGSDTLIPGVKYGFKLGGQEYVTGYVSTTTSNTITQMVRGLSRITATSTITAYQVQWGRGTSVEQTDAPVLIDLANKAAGVSGYEQPIKYDSSIATSTLAADRNSIASAGLVADTAFAGAGVINATTAAKGVVQFSTQLQQASSTILGSSGATLTLSAGNATSTCNFGATSALRVVVTQNNGQIDSNCIATSTLVAGIFTNVNLNGTTTMATSTSYFKTGIRLVDIGKQHQIFTSTGTSTFAVPAGISTVRVRVVGAGGSGGGAANGTSNGGSGGGAGGTCEKDVDVSATSSIVVYVAPATSSGSAGSAGVTGQWSTFGANGFYCFAIGGSAGIPAGSSGNAAGGIASGGDINSTGQGGSGVGSWNASANAAGGGVGGSSTLGGGGYGAMSASNHSSGGAGGNYGGGGGGASSGGSSGADVGGTGAQGIVIISW